MVVGEVVYFMFTWFEFWFDFGCDCLIIKLCMVPVGYFAVRFSLRVLCVFVSVF